MKKILITMLLGCTMTVATMAAPQLPGKCEVSQPQIIHKDVIKEDDVQKLLNSGNWGQSSTTGVYWTVYSDRSHNTTYESPSASAAKCDELEFNEQVRIAKISGDYALVYTEKMRGVQNLVISVEAKSRGWIPMKHLLLWNSCPVNQYGIYNKALIVLNIDAYKSGNADLGKRYMNPDTKDQPMKVISDMHFYFVMKKADNGLVLLARECKMEGYSNAVLYGWVSTSSFVPWDQRTCIEPNWHEDVAKNLVGTFVPVFRPDGQKATSIPMGRENKITDNPSTKYRLEPQLMRYPLLDGKNENDRYFVTAFARPNDGSSHIPTVPTGSDNSAAGIIDKALVNKSIINLIVVIDGTRSMEKFYQPTQKIIQKAYEYFGKENRTVKVGVVIYRDYTDGQYVTEHLSMRSPTDPSVASFLQTGGSYGVKSSSADHTMAEALYKGLEVALDTRKMDYSPNNSNLMLVIGDCGNDLSDNKCLTQEQLVKKCVENQIQLMSFQVRNENDQPFLLFRQQMGAIVRQNVRTQYGQLPNGVKAGFEEQRDGYDFKTNLPKAKNFYIGATRNAPLGKEMELAKLYDLVKNSYLQFNDAIQAQMDIINRGESIIGETEESAAGTKSSIEMEFLIKVFGPEKIKEIRSNNSLMAFQGYTNKKNTNRDMDYWQSIIYISSDEFKQLLEKLKPVMIAADNGDRKPYMDALKALTRSMLPGITEAEMDKKDIAEVMALVAGLNVRSNALNGNQQGGEERYTIAEIGSEEKVPQVKFDELLENFRNKYNKLEKIHTTKYDYSVIRNNTTWYWIPVEDLP